MYLFKILLSNNQSVKMAQILAFLVLGIFTSAYAGVAKLHACDNLRIDSGTFFLVKLDMDKGGIYMEIFKNYLCII